MNYNSNLYLNILKIHQDLLLNDYKAYTSVVGVPSYYAYRNRMCKNLDVVGRELKGWDEV